MIKTSGSIQTVLILRRNNTRDMLKSYVQNMMQCHVEVTQSDQTFFKYSP